MPKEEVTGERDLCYSRWRRTVGHRCYVIDIDGLEYRFGRGPVALIEVTGINSDLAKKKFQLKALRELGVKAGIPSYLVRYQMNPWRFVVTNLADEATVEMNEDEYRQFLREL
jgi:hypothetical protein